jgi:hypothetical protein
MFCEAYDGKLRDAAVGGEKLGDELGKTLALCGKCAAEWKQEHALLAKMTLE